MHLVHGASTDRHVISPALQYMATSLSIRGQEVEMISRDAERSGKPWGPKANERASLIFESEFFLARRSGFQTSPVRDSFHYSRLHEGEFSLDTKGVEQVLGRPESIAYGDEFGKAIDFQGWLGEFGTETGHDRIRDEAVSLHTRNCPIERHVVTNAFQNDHFSIEIDKCAEAEVTMAQEP
jgi:hypothetical protein